MGSFLRSDCFLEGISVVSGWSSSIFSQPLCPEKGLFSGYSALLLTALCSGWFDLTNISTLPL